MQSDQRRCLTILVVAVDRIAYLTVQIVKGVGLGMDGGTHSTGSVRAVVSFLNDKEDFVHGQASWLKSGSDGAELNTKQAFSSAWQRVCHQVAVAAGVVERFTWGDAGARTSGRGSLAPSEQISELLRGLTRIMGGSTHGDGDEGGMAWNDQPPLTISKDQVP
jgi:hypothetical protein